MIFDTHAHYDDKQFDGDRIELLSSMRENNIGRIVDIGSSLESSKRAVELAETQDDIYAAIGVHPSDISCLDEEGMKWLRQQAVHPKVVAIGEIGLDYYWDKDQKVQQAQKEWFCRQLELANEVGLPVVIHSREAAADTMEIMKSQGKGIPGVIHCYSYSPEMAMEYVKMGYFIGVGGVITFKNAKKLVETVEKIPLENIVVETDCPYLAPEPFRGKRNCSFHLPYIIRKIAEIKGLSPEEIERITWENGCRLYRL
jgi:TatD DNase family protein